MFDLDVDDCVCWGGVIVQLLSSTANELARAMRPSIEVCVAELIAQLENPDLVKVSVFFRVGG